MPASPGGRRKIIQQGIEVVIAQRSRVQRLLAEMLLQVRLKIGVEPVIRFRLRPGFGGEAPDDDEDGQKNPW